MDLPINYVDNPAPRWIIDGIALYWNREVGVIVALSTSSDVENNIGIIHISGSMTLGPSLHALREAARELLNTPKLTGIILNVKNVGLADSSGLGELTVIYSLATKRGCLIRLVDTSPSLRKMLEMTRLDGLLPSSVDMAAAKAEIRKSQPRADTAGQGG